MKLKTFRVLAVVVGLALSWFCLNLCAQSVATDLDVDVHHWVNVGPNDSRLSSVAIDPGNSNILYASMEDTGLHKSTDGGVTWSLSNSGLPTQSWISLSSILVDRANGNIVYAATTGSGVFKSTDGGANWNPASQGLTTFATDVQILVAHPSSPSVIYAGTADGVFKSANAGGNWQEANSGIGGTWPSCQVLAVAPGAGTKLYAGFQGADSPLFKSADGAQSWQSAAVGLPAVALTAIAIDPEDSETVYVGTFGQAIFKTTNGGASWQPGCAANPEMADLDVFSLAIDPLNTGTIYAATTSDIYKSVNAGANWMRIRQSSFVTALAADPNRRGTVYFGDLDGLWKSTGAAVTFSPPLDISQHPDWISTMAASAMDAQGKIHVAFVGWFLEEGAPDGVASEIFYTNNVEGSFCPPVRLPTAPVPPDAPFTGNPHYSKVPAIAVDGQGHAHVAYYRTAYQLNGTGLLCYTENTSGSFRTPLTAFRLPNHSVVESAHDISIAIDGLGRVHLAANVGAAGYYTVGVAGVFPDFQPLSAPGYALTSSACLRSDPAGFIHMVLWGENPSGNQDLLYTNKVGGGSFSPPVLVYRSTSFFPLNRDLAVDSQGVAHVVFRGENAGGVRYLNNSAGTFGTPETASGWGFMQDIEVGGQGGRYLAYKYPGNYQALGFTVFEDGEFIDLSPPWEIYGMTSSQWDGGWFQVDEDRHLFHFVYTIADIWYVQARTCDCSISERKRSFGRQGGSGSLGITAAGACPWQVKSTVDWITITPPGAGNGNGTIQYTVASNDSGVERVGKIIAGGQTLVVSQSYRYLTLNEGRFKVEVQWKEPGTGTAHSGIPVNLTNDCGYFWFFSADNLELLVKILDGRGVNGHFWVFYGALTDVEYDLIVTDATTGQVKTYHSPQGVQAGRNDVTAFADSGQSAPGSTPLVLDSLPQGNQLLLNGNRFRVEVDWQTPSGSGKGVAIPLTGDSGYFWFFGETNVELLVKVLDGSGVNNRFWVFYGALTDVQYTITVRDTATGAVKTYQGQQGVQQSGNDINAFPAS